MAHLVETTPRAGAAPAGRSAISSRRNKSNEVWQRELAWISRSSKALYISSRMPSAIWARSTPSPSRLCHSARTPRHRSRWSLSATPCSHAACWSYPRPHRVLANSRTAGRGQRRRSPGAGAHWQGAAPVGNDQVNGYLLATPCDGTGHHGDTDHRARGLQQHPDHRPGRHQPRDQGAA